MSVATALAATVEGSEPATQAHNATTSAQPAAVADAPSLPARPLAPRPHVDGAARDDLVESVTIFEDLLPTARRVLGPAHPFTDSTQKNLNTARAKLQYWGLASQLGAFKL